MEQNWIRQADISAYGEMLAREERSESTIQKYLRDVRAFLTWLSGNAVTKESAIAWKKHLLSTNYTPATINSMLSAINGFFHFIGWDDCRVKFLRIQRRMFRDQSRDLTKTEYQKLLETAQDQGKTRLALLMETICATGIRVSEVKYITVEAAYRGRTDIILKGKIRTILLPRKLCRKLLKYAKTQKIRTGEIFLTATGRSLSRRQIWREMKALCKAADVEKSKVFPHNLRHLFAVTFYKVCKDIVKLADVLGHSSIETTRIYLLSTGTEHIHTLEKLGLLSA